MPPFGTGLGFGHGLGLKPKPSAVFLGAPPEGALPGDAYQEPVSEGDEGYWRYSADGYFQQPL